MAKLEFIRKIKKKDVPSEETQKKNQKARREHTRFLIKYGNLPEIL